MNHDLGTIIRIAARRLRGAYLTALIRMGGGTCGPRLKAERGAVLRWGGHKGIHIGARVRLGRGVVLDVPKGGELRIGDGVLVNHHSVIAVADSITIGRLTQVAELVSIRDSDHGLDVTSPIWEQQLVSTPVVIGEDAWIARGCAVLRGSTVGDGAVLGANSVLKGNLPTRAVAVGAPARVVKVRG